MIMSVIYYVCAAVFVGSATFATSIPLRIAYGLVAVGLFMVAVCQ